MILDDGILFGTSLFRGSEKMVKYLKWMFVLVILVVVLLIQEGFHDVWSKPRWLMKSVVGVSTGPVKDITQRFHTEQKVKHIGFLKVHKAASSTMFNIFYRFGVKHDLNFVIPEEKYHYKRGMKVLKLRKNETFDICDVHTHSYDPKVFRSLLPDDSVYLAIVREPLARMISAAFYYRDRFRVKYLVNAPKETFIKSLLTKPEVYDPGAFSNTRNAMGKDFGFTAADNTPDKISNKLQQLNKEFRLVLVAERFEESLLLMKRTLGWSFSDVLFVKINSHEHRSINITTDERQKFNYTCYQDVAIYDYFSNIFDAKVRDAGLNFQKELQRYRQILHEVRKLCGSETSSSEGISNLTITESKWNAVFNVTKTDCHMMTVTVEETYAMMRKRHEAMHGLLDNSDVTLPARDVI